MALVPLSYNVRSLFVRRSSTLLTVLGIGATVAVLSGVLALQAGFKSLFADHGSDEVAVFLRQGSTNEGDSAFTRERSEILTKSFAEAVKNANGAPLITPELYSAARLFKQRGGETNVPVRGVRPMSFEVHADTVEITEGRVFAPGSDEIVVGRKCSERIRDCKVGDVVQINMTPFRVVGIFDNAGSFSSEIWGDLDRFCEAMERPFFNRVIARLPPGTELGWPDSGDAKDATGIALRMDKDPQVPSKVMTERQYLKSQTGAIGFVLGILGGLLGFIMGVAAIFTATNTMLAAIASRSHEIGILLSIGFRPWAIFLSFMFESLVLGLLGGLAGALMVLPVSGIETGTMNWNTFTEVAFAFRVTPFVLGIAIAFSLALGMASGAWPAFRAARMAPTQALRRA